MTIWPRLLVAIVVLGGCLSLSASSDLAAGQCRLETALLRKPTDPKPWFNVIGYRFARRSEVTLRFDRGVVMWETDVRWEADDRVTSHVVRLSEGLGVSKETYYPLGAPVPSVRITASDGTCHAATTIRFLPDTGTSGRTPGPEAPTPAPVIATALLAIALGIALWRPRTDPNAR